MSTPADARSDDAGIIQVMSDTLANKIAAGEVVQRPASAAKELIENALDAGADEVTLIVKAAGRELVQVVDNGSGMSPDDARRCFQRHATSKIRAIEDLERIRTLGFRGEALASIASVAQVELRTRRRQDAVGTLVRVDGGETAAQEPCATPEGTSIAVRNLFYNVPARRNFLKTPATEFKHLVETFQHLALANPAVAFMLVHDGNEVYRLARTASDDPRAALRQRVEDLLGGDYGGETVAVAEATSYVSIHGVVSVPTFHRRSRGDQFLFVNGRYVKNRYLEHAVTAAYGDALPDNAYPFFALFLDIDPRHVDVNVHPTKAEVKFDDERGIYGVLRAVVKKALGGAELTPQLDVPDERATVGSSGTGFAMPSAPRPFTATPREGGGGGGSWTPGDARPTSRPKEAPGTLTGRLYAPPETPPEHDAPAERTERTERVESEAVQPRALRDERPETDDSLLWQLHERYILTQIRSGLMIVDQSAAHERILYEQALKSLEGGVGLSQQLLFPHTLDFSPADHDLLEELLPDLKALGFDIEFFSGRSVVVRGVPADVRPGTERTILEEIIEQYRMNQDRLQVRGRDNLARSIARRSAVPTALRLSTKAMRGLIDRLFQCEMPYASPSGRPTMIKLSMDELAKRFERG